MLAPVQRASGELVGLQRTYLAHDGAGRAAVPAPKKLLAIHPGSTCSAAVHLGKPDDRLAVAEGIETAIAISESIGIPTWAAPSAAQLAALDVPSHVTRVEIWADGDAAGLRAARTLDVRLRARGVATRILLPPRRGHVG
jgi:putative DNA primase/helicase